MYFGPPEKFCYLRCITYRLSSEICWNKISIIQCFIIIIIIISYRVTARLSTWPVPSTSWKPEKQSLMRSVSWTSILDGGHLSPGQSTTDVLRLEKLSKFKATSTWPLTSVCEAFRLTISYHHCTGYMHSYGGQSTLLCCMVVDPRRRFIRPLTGLVFNPAAILLARKAWWRN